MNIRYRQSALHAQQGFSIVELMVALGLSMMLMMGVVALFVSSRTGYETTERLSRIQENGRYALDQLTGNVREAGFNGCTRPLNTYARRGDYEISTLTDPTSLLLNFAVPVQGYNSNGDGTWSPGITAVTDLGMGAQPDALSDVLVLRVPRRDVTPLRLNKTQVTATETLEAVPVAGGTFNDGDVAMITDCEGRAYFEVTTYDEVSGEITHAAGGKNNSDDLKHPFREGAEIVPMETVIYFLRLRPGLTDPTQLSLWRQINGNTAEELAEGIERMEIVYGEDTDGNGRVDTYVNAAAVINWANVMAARVALLARSPEPYGTDRDPEAYTLLDVIVPAQNDRHQRQVFTTTISLRNQVID